MPRTVSFEGFSRECVDFWTGLGLNNDRLWFEAHKPDYEKFVLEPGRAFILAMGERLREIAPRVHADPRVNQSIFRIYRDTRFSRDKSPYKTHFGLWFWEGTGPRMECSGFYWHLEPPKLMLGVGLYMFPPVLLDEYRRSVVHPRHGAALAGAVREVLSLKGCEIGRKHYKKTPRGFDSGHRNAELLLYNGLYAGMESGIPDEFFSADLVDWCFDKYRGLTPLHRWLLDLTERAQ